MSTLFQDLKFGLRMLAKHPGFTAVAVITLALGIGATTAIFSVVNGVLLSPLPYPQPGRLMILSETSRDFQNMSVSYPNFLDWQRQNRTFSSMAAFRGDEFNLTQASGAEVVSALMVGADFFKTLGVPPALGRGFTAADDHIGAAPTVVLSYAFWQKHFGGKADVIGKPMTMGDQAYTIIGVLPKAFWLPSQRDTYVPIGIYDRLWTNRREDHPGMHVVGRLKTGVTEGEAQADMTNIARRLAKEYPKSNAYNGVAVVAMHHYIIRDVQGTLYLLLGAVCFVLLIACVNVANLLLSRAAARQKEMAIRSALGAGWRRVMRQLLTESVLLSLLGGGLGVLLAFAGTKALLAYVPGELPRAENVGMDLRVLLFVVGAAVLTGILFGLAPALHSARPELNNALKEGGRGSTGGRHRLQNGLVVVELALALVLLIGAGLTLGTIVRLSHVNTGYDTHGALIFSVSLPAARYSIGANSRAFYKNLLDKLRATPGVEAAGATDDMPMRGDDETNYYIAERPKPLEQNMPLAMFYLITPGYLRAMGIRLLRGRAFTDDDTLNAPNVMLIDDAMARTMFPHQDPLGQHIILPGPDGVDVPRQIIGIVGHIKHWGPGQNSDWKVNDAFYMPVAQIPDVIYKAIGPFNATIVLRTSAAPLSVLAAVKRAVHSIDPDVAVDGVDTMDGLIRTSLTGQRFTMLLMVIFAALALSLAAIGIYGVISYSVSQRTHEIGIRMALGAQGRDVLLWVIRQGMTLALIGVAAGVVGAFFTTKFLAKQLYGIKPTDPVTFISVSLILAAVALLACYIPARRATRVDPLTALRHE
ncbi:MAG TPA: ABC transporter permease [Terriglobia bacterium]|nr:ABC transporter permease [Terriglobia bacterium]